MRLPAAVLAAVLLLAAPAAAKTPKPKLKILGFTTSFSTSPEAKNGGKISPCTEDGAGQRRVRVIYSGRGISKGTKVGVALWGGPPSGFFTAEPTDADTMKNAFKWPVSAKQTFVQGWGMTFAKGPFGPERIDGVWYAKLLMKKKVVARASVTIAC